MLTRDVLNQLPVGQIVGLSRDEKLMAWQETARELALLVMRERDLRLLCVNDAFPDAKEGTHSIEIGNGYLAKVEVKMNYSIANTEDMRSAVSAACSEEQRLRLVKYKPDLSVREWKEGLSEEQRNALAPHVTIKPGLPTLSILAPGDPGNKR